MLVAVLALTALAWREGGWRGIALVVSGLVLWLLLNYTQVMKVMRRASENPVGVVGNAVELNARLKRGDSLLRVVAITQSLGRRLSEAQAQPEIYCWTDPGQSCVTARFEGGRLKEWQLEQNDRACGA
jgi:uncharacterized protein (DUF58 family)